MAKDETAANAPQDSTGAEPMAAPAVGGPADNVDASDLPENAGASAVEVIEPAAEPTPAAAFELPTPAPIPNFGDSSAATPFTNIELLDDVELDVKIELGRTEMYIEDVLRLGVGSVVELDRLAGDPVDIYVNERLIARGEVMILNDNFCVRVNDIVNPLPESDPQR